ncbi:MAG: malto-oligosyltrehalose synthase [Rhodoferax sp.]|nr:malto-oligosyltrehalose synthase [Rhodoferax sp.]
MVEHWHDNARAALHRLCAHYGIATHYHDVWGHHKEVGADALLALLREFDAGIDTPATLEAAWERARDAVWDQSVTPVLALPEGTGQWRVPIRLPMDHARLRWRLLDEQGGLLRDGDVDALSLEQGESTERAGVAWCLRHLVLELPLAIGYYQLLIDGLAPQGTARTLLVCAPAQCYRPPALRDGGRVWGPAVQLYTVRSQRNWGIGDFGDLEQLVRQMAERGADIVGLNPLHAMFAHNPAHASPYSPSSRRQLNVLYIDVPAVDEFSHCTAARQRFAAPEFQQRLARLRNAALVDYAGVAAAKQEILQLLYAHFVQHHLGADGAAADDHGQAFVDFVTHGGDALRQHALFEAIQARLHADDASVWGWPVWPDAWRDPDGAAVRDFARDHGDAVRFHQYQQWLATRQLARVRQCCEDLGMGVGLYLDLAVSVDRAGSDSWSHQHCFAAHASVGAPPDEFNPNGQGWGLPALRPDRLRADHYRLFIDTLRSAMRASGALRIDHVMGLMRLFWIPGGYSARDGAYVHYALDEMLAIVALESQRNRCMVIGEDLGTVADEMRQALARRDVLSYRLLYFERSGDGGFRSPSDYPGAALAAVSTHDLATLAGWWCGHDLQQRLRLGLYPSEHLFEKQLADRAQERTRLLLALRHANLLSAEAVAAVAGKEQLPGDVMRAVHAYLAGAPSAVMMVQMEDVLSVTDQVNMPSTTHEHPNWRRKLPIGLAELRRDDGLGRLAQTLSAIRPRRMGARAPGPAGQARIPRATYRLQFQQDFGFDDAVRILPYLAQLGVSHVYCSPIHRARAGSTHGYDVVAHDEINPELGGPQAFERFCAALQHHGMGQLLDMVPNHMGVLGGDNAWWNDVLENGPCSLYARHFDIDWQPLNAQLRGKVLLPVLGNHYGDVLMAGELQLAFEASGGSFALHYFDHRFPLAPETYATLLQPALERVTDPDLAAALASVSAAFGHLPEREDTRDATRHERARDKELLKARLGRLVTRHDALAHAIAGAVAELNVEPSRDGLHRLIEAQAYRLAFWRVAADEINYRRFFDINDLAALRIERSAVFEATQSMALDLAARGVIDGLRIDHPDGLYDPAHYFARLQRGYAARRGWALPATDADGRPQRPLYVVAEKIAAAHEEIPLDWAIHGTTGYRFANVAGGVLVDTEAGQRFAHIWRNFTGDARSFETLAHDGKRDIMRFALAAELQVLSTELVRIAHADRRTRDYTHNELRRALAEVVAAMPVYRSYIRELPSQQDRRYIEWAVTEARNHSQDADLSIFDFVRDCLLAQPIEGADAALRTRIRHFAVRFQQFSAPVTAKGVEDTAFYRYFPLSSLNEVGGEPAVFGYAPADFHAANADRVRRWPHTMLATSTHDNKRSEDVRCRIHVLSEIPARWRLALRRWRQMNRALRSELQSQGEHMLAPSRADEYLLYQTLLGTLPVGGLDDAQARETYVLRIVRYMHKAAREAKVHTRWTVPNTAYEDALEHFVRGLLRPGPHNPFLDDLRALTASLAWFGAFNSLALAMLKFSCPGVPDLYQGMETLQLTLVDPDNRSPVDHARLAGMLDALRRHDPGQAASLLAHPEDGRAKMWVTWRMLTLRRQRPELLRDGDYTALATTGAAADHVIAFRRGLGDTSLIVLVPRLLARLMELRNVLPVGTDVWTDTGVELDLPDGTRMTDTLTGRTIEVQAGRIGVAQAFAHFPMAAFVTGP